MNYPSDFKNSFAKIHNVHSQCLRCEHFNVVHYFDFYEVYTPYTFADMPNYASLVTVLFAELVTCTMHLPDIICLLGHLGVYWCQSSAYWLVEQFSHLLFLTCAVVQSVSIKTKNIEIIHNNVIVRVWMPKNSVGTHECINVRLTWTLLVGAWWTSGGKQ